MPFVVAGAVRFGPIAFVTALALACGLNAFGDVLAHDGSSSTAGIAVAVLAFYATFAVLLVAGVDGVVRRARGDRSSGTRRDGGS